MNYSRLAFVCCSLLATVAVAEFPSIRFDRLYPLGIAAGDSVEVDVAGSELEGLQALRFDHPGLSAEAVAGKEKRFKITASADVPAGTYDVRLVGRFGVSNSKLLAVQKGLTEVIETEPNNDESQSQVVQVNSVVNGQSDGENVDRFRFTLKAGQRIVLDVAAQKLDSQLDSQLLLLNAAGKQLASSGDYHGRDSLIDFIAPVEGEYIAMIHDLSYRGGQPYRLTISDRPHVENVFPRAIQRGQNVQITAYGRNLGGTVNGTQLSGEPGLEAFSTTYSSNIAAGDYTFLDHPTDHSVLPTAATFRLSGAQFRPTFSTGESLTAIPMVVVDTPITIDTESNDSQETPQAITLPATISGRFESRGDADWFEFTASETAPHSIEVYAERIAGQADPYVVLVDEKGMRVVELDDSGPRVNGFDGHIRDPIGSSNLQKDKKYRVLVQDRYQRGGPRYQYVLAIRKSEPDLFVASIHRENQNPAGLNLRAGGATWLDLVLYHRDGQTTPVTITAENLPPGVHFTPTIIPNDTKGVFVLWADENVAESVASLQLFATYKRGEEQVKRAVRPYTRVWTDKNSSRPTRELAVAIREKSPYFVATEQERYEAKPNEKLSIKVNIQRLWPEFTGDMKLLPLSLPNGFQMPEVAVPAGAKEAMISITPPANAKAEEYTLTLQAQAQVPYNKDPAAKEKPNTLVSIPSRPFAVQVVPMVK